MLWGDGCPKSVTLTVAWTIALRRLLWDGRSGTGDGRFEMVALGRLVWDDTYIWKEDTYMKDMYSMEYIPWNRLGGVDLVVEYTRWNTLGGVHTVEYTRWSTLNGVYSVEYT